MQNGQWVSADGTIRYLKNGQMHRDDGPAVIYPNGDKYWYKNGNFFREGDLPVEVTALVQRWTSNHEEWHRDYAPAMIYKDGREYWYHDGINVTIEINDWIEENNYPNWQEWDDNIKMHFKLTFL